jgi:hypothetical protein
MDLLLCEINFPFNKTHLQAPSGCLSHHIHSNHIYRPFLISESSASPRFLSSSTSHCSPSAPSPDSAARSVLSFVALLLLLHF